MQKTGPPVGEALSWSIAGLPCCRGWAQLSPWWCWVPHFCRSVPLHPRAQVPPYTWSTAGAATYFGALGNGTITGPQVCVIPSEATFIPAARRPRRCCCQPGWPRQPARPMNTPVTPSARTGISTLRDSTMWASWETAPIRALRCARRPMGRRGLSLQPGARPSISSVGRHCEGVAAGNQSAMRSAQTGMCTPGVTTRTASWETAPIRALRCATTYAAVIPGLQPGARPSIASVGRHCDGGRGRSRFRLCDRLGRARLRLGR